MFLSHNPEWIYFLKNLSNGFEDKYVKFGNNNVKKNIMGQIYTDHWYTYIILLATIEDATLNKIWFLPLAIFNLAAEENI